MSSALAIAKKEFRSYFNSPVAYVVVSVFMLVAGFRYFTLLFLEKQAELLGFFGFAPILFAFVVPAVTMRLLAEEKSSGSLELLITMQVRDWEVVVGKFLAGLGLMGVLIALTLVYAFTVAAIGPLDSGPAIGGYLGMLLMAAAYTGIGVMASAFTKNPIVAFLVAFFISFGLFLIGQFVQILPESIQGFVSFISIGLHFDNISRGVVDTRDVLYYLSVVAITLTIATLSLQSRRWK